MLRNHINALPKQNYLSVFQLLLVGAARVPDFNSCGNLEPGSRINCLQNDLLEQVKPHYNVKFERWLLSSCTIGQSITFSKIHMDTVKKKKKIKNSQVGSGRRQVTSRCILDNNERLQVVGGVKWNVGNPCVKLMMCLCENVTCFKILYKEKQRKKNVWPQFCGINFWLLPMIEGEN